MRILIIPSWYPNEENPIKGVFFKEQAEALSNQEVDITVLTISLASLSTFPVNKVRNKLECCKENGIKVYRYDGINICPRVERVYLNYYRYLLSKFIKYIEKEDGEFDLVHIHSAFDAGLAYGQMQKFIPYTITEHSSKYARNLVTNLERKLLKDTFNKASKVITVGKGLAQDISEYCNNKDIKIVPNMVNIHIKDSEKDKNKKRFRFFSLAFLNKNKSMDILIEAFFKNREELINCELYIGGDGEERENLQRKIDDLDLNNRVILLGALDREAVNYYMTNCDAFVLASKVETFGVVFIEAMMHGKPVISTKTGGPDTFINDKVGKVVTVDDIVGLGDAMYDVYSNYSQYDSKYIKQYCKENFSQEEVSNKLISIYREVRGQ